MYVDLYAGVLELYSGIIRNDDGGGGGVTNKKKLNGRPYSRLPQACRHETCCTVLGYSPHITPGQRELRNGIRTAPICPEIIAKPSARRRLRDHLTQHFGGRAGCFCVAFCMALAPGDNLHAHTPLTCTECAVGEFKIGRSGVRRSSALGPDRLGHARTFRLGTQTKFKPLCCG
eukprot:scaffold8060_cov110-Isochrysis_galbana.AAC.3